MLFRRGDQIIYQVHNRCVTVDTVTPNIIFNRMINAGYSTIFSRLVASGKLNLDNREMLLNVGKKLRLLQ